MEDFAAEMEEMETYLVKMGKGVQMGEIRSLLKVGRQERQESKDDL